MNDGIGACAILGLKEILLIPDSKRIVIVKNCVFSR